MCYQYITSYSIESKQVYQYKNPGLFNEILGKTTSKPIIKNEKFKNNKSLTEYHFFNLVKSKMFSSSYLEMLLLQKISRQIFGAFIVKNIGAFA